LSQFARVTAIGENQVDQMILELDDPNETHPHKGIILLQWLSTV